MRVHGACCPDLEVAVDRRKSAAAFDAAYVGTYVWTDSYGRQGTVDVHASAHADPPVQVRTADGAGHLLAAVDRAGQPVWSRLVLGAYGMDTAAARNDLIEIARQTYLELPDTR
jgi:hypothetical protein